MLGRKLRRTAGVYKVQFISMILLIMLGMGVFVGFNAEWVTIEQDTNEFFEQSGFADYRIIDEDGFTAEDMNNLIGIEGISGAGRFLSINTEVEGTSNQLALTISESASTSGFVLMEGDEYDRDDAEGFWLVDKYAELNGINIGDELTVTFEDMEFTGTVRGLIESAEYLICVRDESQLMPDLKTFGYVFGTPAMMRKVIEDEVREEEPDLDDDEMSIAVKAVYEEVFPQVNISSDMTKEEILLGSLARIIHILLMRNLRIELMKMVKNCQASL